MLHANYCVGEFPQGQSAQACHGADASTSVQYAALLDVGPRENQKHDRRDAKKHYATRTMALVSTL